MEINEAKLNEFMGRAVGDIGAAMSTALCILGEKLGLYKAMHGAGPLTPGEIAKKTNTAERYVREWCMNQAAGGYITYDSKTGKFTLPPEQGMALADDSSPVYLHGAFEVITSVIKDVPKIEKVFRTGGGLHWGEHDHCLFIGTERFFRSSYIGHLVKDWIPALDGVEEKLRHGAKVADVGCGYGASTILMARAFPKSTFAGYDSHGPSIEAARERAVSAGLHNITFQVANATDFPGANYDLVACFDCLHDMGDPIGAASHIRDTLREDGTFMIVEPAAGDKPEDNLNPVGRVYYAASTMVCVPASLASDGPALGAQAGEARLREVATKGGFGRFRRATQTPFNMVLEARP